MDKYLDLALNFIDQMEPHHWIIALAVVILVGFICMKSMGQKMHY